jgi:cytochrome c biogenesis protein CcdA/thiol-disulfide isomerase/thioredoxin
VAGIVTAISPCVLPVLPILLAGGASGRKPLRIITGLVASFTVFTLFASWILDKLGLPQDFLRNLAIALLFVVAATLLVPQLGLLVERPFARLTRFRAGGGGFVLGVSLGLVFVPCAGPVLAAITVVAANNHVGWRAVLLTVAYAVGAAIPMLLIAFGGRGLASRLRAEGGRLRIASGVVIALVALLIAFNQDARFQTLLPGYTQALQNHIEDNNTAQKQLAKIRGGKQTKESVGIKLQNYGPAPNFEANGDWFNSKPLSIASLRGKVVLVDFWTYSCINCLRTLPHLEAWYTKYHKDGLEIVGVHTPEFAFEHVSSNVGAAIKRLGINYPVVQDNDYRTWDAYGNQYWPAEFLVDKFGNVRHVHFAEGDYDQTEEAIRELLGITRGSVTHIADLTPTEPTTQESYLGFDRLDRYVGSPIKENEAAHYTLPKDVPSNDLAYGGTWMVDAQRIISGANASLQLHFYARDVYIVLGGHGKVGISIDGKPARPVEVNSYRLYTVRMSDKLVDKLLTLTFTPGVQAYSFTFG